MLKGGFRSVSHGFVGAPETFTRRREGRSPLSMRLLLSQSVFTDSATRHAQLASSFIYTAARDSHRSGAQVVVALLDGRVLHVDGVLPDKQCPEAAKPINCWSLTYFTLRINNLSNGVTGSAKRRSATWVTFAEDVLGRQFNAAKGKMLRSQTSISGKTSSGSSPTSLPTSLTTFLRAMVAGLSG